ncbi:BUD32 family EKC/KEOPS complex subunit [Schlesneria paludicola]|uniref:hypothetical protein n=1 Tax=Schlesneria paludicola TaxID=360056 RepID=UPI00029A692A|nr:hypothetical protein [Schlesneria paludicola]
MVHQRLMQMRHECRRLLGMMLGKVRLHRIEFLSVSGVDVVRKQRRFLACLIIPWGNAFQWLTGSPHFALPVRQWLAWERAIDASTRQGLVLIESSGAIERGSVLVCRHVPGDSLSRILADCRYSPAQKLDAIRLALTALRRLHAVDADWGNGTYRSISHGDATACNVIVDMRANSACWIDFETRHDPQLAEVDRQTDDLRSLVYTSAAHLPVSSFCELADVLLQVDIDRETHQRLKQRLTTEWIHLTPFQLAQSPLRWSVAMALRTALLEVC